MPMIGEYPCCNEPLMLEIESIQDLPKFQKECCPNCRAVVWHKLSRIDGQSWCEKDFPYEINEETKTINYKKIL